MPRRSARSKSCRGRGRVAERHRARPAVRHLPEDGVAQRLECDVIAGATVRTVSAARSFRLALCETVRARYPFGWLGSWRTCRPIRVMYCHHENGFALASMRSPQRSRCYSSAAFMRAARDWPDERFWNEFALRLGKDAGARVTRGPSFEKSIAPLRSFAPNRCATDTVLLATRHISCRRRDKGAEPRRRDALMLSEALARILPRRIAGRLDGYSERALARVWKAERFSWWSTRLTHRFVENVPSKGGSARRVRLLRSSRAAQSAFAENYVGLPVAPGKLV